MAHFGLGRGVGFIGSRTHRTLNFGAHFADLVLGDEPMLEKILLGKQDGIAIAGPRQLFPASILRLIVGRRVRIQPHNFGFDQDRSSALAHPLNERRHDLVHRFVPGSIDVIAGESKACSNAMNFRGGLRILRDTDGVTIVLDQEQDGQFLARRPIQGFGKFAFTGCAFAR